MVHVLYIKKRNKYGKAYIGAFLCHGDIASTSDMAVCGP